MKQSLRSRCRHLFAHPYFSRERGINENTNGLIRQYFPKGADFNQVTDNDALWVMDRLNNRLRKIRGCQSPNELFMGLQVDYSLRKLDCTDDLNPSFSSYYRKRQNKLTLYVLSARLLISISFTWLFSCWSFFCRVLIY